MVFWLLSAWVLVLPSSVYSQPSEGHITVLYDAFGKPSDPRKDWGFSAYIEYDGKRMLFDTGNNAEIFAHNVKTKGIDLTNLDFAVVSHRHGDHTSGLNHLMTVNPGVQIYAPKDEIRRIATSLRDQWKVAWIAPVHCTGEPAFAILKESFGDRYLYAGLGTTLAIGATIKPLVEAGQSPTQNFDERDSQSYRELLAQSHDNPHWLLAHIEAKHL